MEENSLSKPKKKKAYQFGLLQVPRPLSLCPRISHFSFLFQCLKMHKRIKDEGDSQLWKVLIATGAELMCDRSNKKCIEREREREKRKREREREREKDVGWSRVKFTFSVPAQLQQQGPFEAGEDAPCHGGTSVLLRAPSWHCTPPPVNQRRQTCKQTNKRKKLHILYISSHPDLVLYHQCGKAHGSW